MFDAIKANNIYFKLVTESDAEFILSLRMDETYNMHLSPVDGNLENQRIWIRNYKNDEKNNRQYYFIIYSLNDEKIGTLRLYNFNDGDFCWGSWIIKKGCVWSAALESVALAYHIGFDILKFTSCHFDVRKENLDVLNLHQKLGALITGNCNVNYYLEMPKEKAKSLITKILKK